MTKLNLSEPLTDLQGNPIKVEEGKPFLAGIAIASQISMKKPDNLEETIKDYMLVRRLSRASGGEIELSPAEVIRAQKAVIAGNLTTLVAGQLLVMLEATTEEAK